MGHLEHGAEPETSTTLAAGFRREIEADAGAVAATFARFVNHELDEDEQHELLAALCGVRLLYEAQDLVERSHFLLRPPSHASPQARYKTLKDVALRSWVPSELLNMADDLTSTLAEICALCRSFEPRPRYPESLKDELKKYLNFPPTDGDDEHWQAVDDIEESLRVFTLSIPQHLAQLSRGVGAPTFEDQLKIIQLSVKLQTRALYEEDFDNPDVMSTMQGFGDVSLDDPDEHWNRMARLSFDSTWGARLFPRVLGPVLKKVRTAADNGSGLSSNELTSWVKSSVPEKVVLPSVALLRRILRDPSAETIISQIAAQDLTGMEHRLMRAADQENLTSFVPDWTYFHGRLGRRAHLLIKDLIPPSADMLETWLLEADEAIWRFSSDGGTALSELFERARGAAADGLKQGEAGADTVTAYLRLVMLTKPRHARLKEAMSQQPAAFHLMREVLPALNILAGPERTGELALHLGTKAAERGWFAEVNQVAEFVEALLGPFNEVAVKLRTLASSSLN